MAAARTFGSYSFTCAPHRLDRTALENERAQQERVRRYGQQEPPAMAQYRAMEPDETVAQLQDLEHEIWALGREKRRMDSAEFVKRLAQSSMAHKAGWPDAAGATRATGKRAQDSTKAKRMQRVTRCCSRKSWRSWTTGCGTPRSSSGQPVEAATSTRWSASDGTSSDWSTR